MFEKWADKFKEKSKEPEIVFGSFDGAAEESVKTPIEDSPAPQPPTAAIKADADQRGNIELKVVRPESYAEVGGIADHLLAGCTVVLNLELLDRAVILRMLDFLNGVTYSTDGEIKKVAPTTYIITPNNVDVSDDN